MCLRVASVLSSSCVKVDAMADHEQLAWIPEIRVQLEYHPLAAPPDAEGPGDRGAFVARIGDSELEGWGRSESIAVRRLAVCLRRIGNDTGPWSGVSPLSQGFAAAERFELDELHVWLLARAEAPTLHEGSNEAELRR
jgi:hypothetical protein